MSANGLQSTLDVYDIVIKLLMPIAVSALAAFFSARLALNKFYKEKWWEKKLEAFTEIINISYRIKMADDYYLKCEYAQRDEHETSFKPHPKEIEDKLTAEYWLDLQELERIAQLADFTLTSTVREMLIKYVAARQKIMNDCYDDAIDNLSASETDFTLSEKLLRDLVSEAKKELKTH